MLVRNALIALLVWLAAAPAYAQERPDDRTLNVGIASLPTGLGNPFLNGGFPGIDVYHAMFDGLVEVHEDGTFKPGLALEWNARDPLTWVFKLRGGVKFANGAPFNAASVIGVYNILSSDLAKGWSMIREIRNVESMIALDDLTLEIRTRTPDLMFPRRFAAIKMVEPSYWNQIGAEAFAKAPIGTGPYVVNSWANQRVEMTANPHAWRPPQAQRMTLRAVPEPAARVAGLQTQSLDIALNLGAEDIPVIESSGGRVYAYPQSGVLGMSFILVKQTPFSDARVRRAITHGVNRQAIVDTIFAGRAKVASQATPSTAFGFDPGLKPYPYDPAKAKALLAEAGYPNGFSFTVEVMTPSSTDSPLWQQVAADLAKVGVTMNVIVLPFPRYNEGLYQGTWAGEAFGMNYGSLPALDPMIGFQYHSCLWLKPWVCNEKQTELIRSITTEFDRDKREALTRQLLRETHDDPIGLYLYEVTRFDGLGPRIAAYRSPFGYTAYHDIKLK